MKNGRIFSILCSMALLQLAAFNLPPAFAEEASSGGSADSAANSGSANDGTAKSSLESPVKEAGSESEPKTEGKSELLTLPPQILKGGVRGSAVRLEEGLVLIEQSAKMVQEPALEIAKECTRKETATMRGPNYIGNGIVIPAIGNPNGTIQIGELPARKDRVDAFISSAVDAIKALRSHVDGLIIPEGSPEDMVNLWKGMQSTMQAAENNINSMKDLVAEVPVKRGEIKQKEAKPLGRAALKIYDSMTALEKMRSRLDDMVKPELKKE